MHTTFDLISKKTKYIVILIAIVIAVGINFKFNRNYLQSKMFGSWDVNTSVSDDIGEGFEVIEITNDSITFDGKKVSTINYGSKSTRRNFSRIDEKGATYYRFFKDDSLNKDYYDYMLGYNRKNPDILLLTIFKDDSVGISYQLIRSEEKNDG